MYLFYQMSQRGFPVNEIYDEFKDIPTDRFMEYISNQEQKQQQKQNLPVDDEGNPIPPPDISFDSQSDVDPLFMSSMPQPPRPEIVPQLNLDCIPDYVTSSDEEGEEEEDSGRPWEDSESIPEHKR